MGDHAFLPPSGASIWGFCSAWPYANQATPDRDTEHTRNGTAAHWVGSEVLDAYRGMSAGPTDPHALVGETADNGVVVDRTMADGASIYIDDVIETLEREGIPLGSLLVEKRVHMPRIHEQNWGTLDAAARKDNVIYIWDYKHGHSPVEAYECLQLVDYVEGLCEFFKINGHEEQYINVVMRVVQPFCYKASGPTDEWRVPLTDLRPLWNQLKDKANEVFTNPTFTTGTHCKHCPGRNACKARREADYNLIDLVNLPIGFDSLTANELATEYDILAAGQAILKKRLEALEDELMHRITSEGQACSKTVETVKGRNKWTVEPDVAIATAAMLGVDISRTACDTPAQALQKVPKELRETFEMALAPITKRDTSLKLIDQKDSVVFRAFGKK